LPCAIGEHLFGVGVALDVRSVDQVERLQPLVLPDDEVGEDACRKLRNAVLHPSVVQHFAARDVVLLLHARESEHKISLCLLKCEHERVVHVQQLEQQQHGDGQRHWDHQEEVQQEGQQFG